MCVCTKSFSLNRSQNIYALYVLHLTFAHNLFFFFWVATRSGWAPRFVIVGRRKLCGRALSPPAIKNDRR